MIPFFHPLFVRLRDGTPAVIRSICSADAAKLAEGLGRLSSDSRFHRFFRPKSRFSAEELRALTTEDGGRHLALVLGILDDAGREVDTVAVARCFRQGDRPRLGEVVVTTIDEWQGVGIASLLLRSLARHCRDVGIGFWRVTTLDDRPSLPRKLIDPIARRRRERSAGPGAVEVFYALPRALG